MVIILKLYIVVFAMTHKRVIYSFVEVKAVSHENINWRILKQLIKMNIFYLSINFKLRALSSTERSLIYVRVQ